ncbi:pentapeptide repeat-containing protein [Hyalangium versicolor]|uniref:pentapeptide repeat-containing protein n=1 Tax=Hyalangium versicolor TaxID=2861190 RepID=UPI001CCA6FA7|nr:pentapeptide repeat-containing protein [Hyalangium versicolor]
MLKFRDREIANEQLVLDSRTELYYLGPSLTLRNCTLIVKVPAKALELTRTRLIDCTIEVARVLKSFSWDDAHLTGCCFKGRYVGNDFGNWRGTSEASIVDCDFTAAHLDMTRFLSCDARTLRFPRWPCFTIFDPAQRAAELAALPWPGKKGPILAEGFVEDPPSTAAVTFAATDLAKWSGTTPEAIKAVLEKLDGVYY